MCYLLYLVIRPNYKTMNCVVCFGDFLKFPKCIIFCVHWFQTPTLTVANKPHIYNLKANYKTMDCVVCFGDCLIFAKSVCIIFCVIYLPTASCLLSVLAKKLINILPHGLLIWLEDKTLTSQ